MTYSLEKAEAMERKAWLYSKMSDSLRADAAKIRYEAAHPARAR